MATCVIFVEAKDLDECPICGFVVGVQPLATSMAMSNAKTFTYKEAVKVFDEIAPIYSGTEFTILGKLS